MGLGFQNAAGIANAYQSLDQMLAGRKADELLKQKIAQQEFENRLNLRRSDQSEEQIGQSARELDLREAASHAPEKPMVVNGRLVTPSTGAVIADFHDPTRTPLVTGVGPDGKPTRVEDVPGAAVYQEPKPPSLITGVGPNGTPTRVPDQPGARVYQAPKETPMITVNTVDANGNPVTRVVPKTAGSEFQKAPNATVANRLASAVAVRQTGDDMIAKLSDPAFAAKVGPAMGRYNTLRDFIGNPPPEYAELAGQIESYSLANMGVHGMRSTQGAEQIKHLLDQHHTPASLIATINGLNSFSQHFIENETKVGANPNEKAPVPPKSGGVTIKSITEVK